METNDGSLDYSVRVRQAEIVVYKNGQFVEDVGRFVESKVGNTGLDEIVMTTHIHNLPSDSGLTVALRALHREFIGRCPIENGCYPLVERKRRHVEGHLHFSPAYSSDGKTLAAVIHRIDELRKLHGAYNKRTTITVLIKTYSDRCNNI